MRVAVFGATGNVGSALLDRLSEDPGIDAVSGFARRRPGRSWPKTTVHQVDVARDDVRPHLEGVDAVVHVAWIFQPTHRTTETWAVNVGGTARLLDAVAAAGVGAVVYSSSVGAYTPAFGEPVDEAWPTDGLPTAAYGREKAYVERLLDAFEARHQEIRVVRFRPGFVFQRRAATEQRRLFAGPFAPASLLRPGALPVLPYPRGLRFQAVHADDVADAFAAALSRDVRGAFNLAADPIVGGEAVAGLLETRLVTVPPVLVRSALAAGWRAHLVPAEPALFDLAMGLPIMRTDRARQELGWSPATSATDALAEALEAMRQGAGGHTAPLAPDSPGRRLQELATGIGGHA